MGDQFPTDQKGCLCWTPQVGYRCQEVSATTKINKYTFPPCFLAQLSDPGPQVYLYILV